MAEGGETPNTAPEVKETIKNSSEETKEHEPREPTAREIAIAKLKKLEESEISGDLKDMIRNWAADNIQDPVRREAVLDNMKNKTFTLREYIEGMADIYLSQHPEMLKKIEEMRTKDNTVQLYLADAMFDTLFQHALGKDYLPGKGDPKTERILERFKEIIC